MENIEFRKDAVNASNCISEGFNFIKSNYWLFFAMGVVNLIIVIIAGNIPYAGSIINIVVSGALICGIYIALLAQWRGESVPFALMFEGFSRILPTTLVTLVSSIPLLIFGLLIGLFVTMPDLTANPEDPTAVIKAVLNPAFLVPVSLGYLAAMLVGIVFSLLLFFSMPLIAEHNATFGEAVSLSFRAASGNIGGLILLLVLEILLGAAGLIACGVGIFFVMPIIYAANIAAYKSVFPDHATANNQEPPSPDRYDETYGMPQ